MFSQARARIAWLFCLTIRSSYSKLSEMSDQINSANMYGYIHIAMLWNILIYMEYIYMEYMQNINEIIFLTSLRLQPFLMSP